MNKKLLLFALLFFISSFLGVCVHVTMNQELLFLISWFVFVCVSAALFIMRDFYKAEMQSFLRSKIETIHKVTSFLVSALLVLGIIIFVLHGAENISQALVRGALFGLVVHGVCNLSNFVIINNWSLRLLFVDLTLGCFLSAIMSGFMFWLAHKL